MKLAPLQDHVDLGPELARGGFMRVFTGTLRDGGDAVVVKLPLRPPGTEKPRLVREARLVAGVAHPSLARLRGVYSHPGGPLALVYDHVQGPSLREAMGQGQVPRDAALDILEDVASGLDGLHDAGLVCRDVKPANVVLRPDAPCVIVDFGLIRGGDQPTLTAEGIVMGTPVYLAPEGFRGQRLGKPADVYALAVMAYEVLVGRPPFGGDLNALARQHLSDPPPKLAGRTALPGADLDRVFARALAKDPAARHLRAGEFVAALREAIEAPGDRGLLSRSPTLRLASSRPEATPPLGARTTRKRGDARRAAAGLAGLLGLGGLVAWALVGRTLAPAPQPSPTVPAKPAPDPGLPPLDVEALRDELAAMSIDMDPYVWPEQVRRVAGVQRFRRWLQERPPAAPVAPEAAALARRAGEAFRVVGLDSPFEPFLEVAPCAEPVAPRATFREGHDDLRSWARAFPEPRAGYLGTAVADIGELWRIQVEQRRWLRDHPTGPFPDGVHLPQAEFLWRLAGKIDVLNFLSQVGRTRDNRQAIRPWVAEPEELLQRVAIALVRAVEVDPNLDAPVSRLLRVVLDVHMPYLFGRLHRLSAEELTGRPLPRGEVPLSWLMLEGDIEEHASRVETETAATDVERFVREVEARLAILRRESATLEEARYRCFSVARSRLRTVLVGARGTAAAEPLRRRVEAALDELAPEGRAHAEEGLAALAE